MPSIWKWIPKARAKLEVKYLVKIYCSIEKHPYKFLMYDYLHFSAYLMTSLEDPYPSLSDFHDYEPQLEFDDSELHQPVDEDGGKSFILNFFCDFLLKTQINATNPTLKHFSVELVGSDIDDYILDSPISDGPFMDGNYTIEENFEEALGSVSMIPEAVHEHTEASLAHDQDFSDVARYGIVDVVGDDTYGRKVIVVSACRLPSNKVLDQNRFLRLYHIIYYFIA